MKSTALATLAVLVLSIACFAQTPAPSAFSTTSFSFNLAPITLPNMGATASGAETDAIFPLTANNRFGETTLIGASTFIGGRYERVFPSLAKYLQEHTALTGGNFEGGITSSLGVVKGTVSSWGGRAGFFLHYAPAGSTSFNIGFEAQANYLPNYAGSNTPHWLPSVAIGPNFRF